MGSTKFDMEKFDGTNDFSMWRVKMRALLVSQGIDEALDGEDNLSTSLSDKEKRDIMKKAYSAIVLSLTDRILRKVAKETTAAGVWAKLESLYMTKSLANKLYLKKRLYALHLTPGGSLEEHLDEFNKLVLDLENLDVAIDDEDVAVHLLASLPPAYEHFSDTLMYGRSTITLENVMAALSSKELKKKMSQKEEVVEALATRGRPERRESRGRNQFRSKSKGRRRCFVCQSENHFKKDCPEWKKRKNSYQHGSRNKEKQCDDTTSEGYESAEVLVVSQGKNPSDWILDSGCTYHMTPDRKFFMTYQRTESGPVTLGDDHICVVKGTGDVLLRL